MSSNLVSDKISVNMSIPSMTNTVYNKMNKLDDFIGKWRRLKQAGKEANLVLNTLAGYAWATLSHW